MCDPGSGLCDGFDSYDWAENWRTYFSPDNREAYLTVNRLEDDTLVSNQQCSDYTLLDYKAAIDAIPADLIPQTVQF